MQGTCPLGGAASLREHDCKIREIALPTARKITDRRLPLAESRADARGRQSNGSWENNTSSGALLPAHIQSCCREVDHAGDRRGWYACQHACITTATAHTLRETKR